jgi:hypothetical protein
MMRAAVFLSLLSAKFCHAANATDDCVSTAPSGVDTSSYIVFEDADPPFCAVCGDGVYKLDGETCTCGNGDRCNVWPLSGEWSD